ncbi:MAG: TolC family protein [Gemmatimonadetes bacterium]|nr:TolC family protein [Gemmatimonadota bacterium]MBI3567283.1 TolC family protein [Gemmatimonadota bacterium]
MFPVMHRAGPRRWSRTVAHLVIALLALPACASSQSPAAPPRDSLRLGTLLDAVERGSPRLEAARATARAARARVPGVTRPPDPQFQVGWMNYELPGLRPMDVLGMTQVQLMQMVPVAGKLRLAGEAETARADASATRVMDVSLDLRARASMIFYDIYVADGTLGVARDTKRLLQEISDLAAKMYQVGEGRQADVLRADVELARMQEDIIRMETMRTTMAARLNALLAAPSDAAVGAPQLPRFPAALPTLDSLAQLAERHRPMLRAGEQDVEAADASARLAQREIWPDVQVGVQLGTQGGAMGPQRMGSLMVGASLPVFAGSRQLQMREEASAMRAMAAAELASMRADTRGAVGEARADLVRARRLTELYRTSVLPQAEATVTSSLASYRVGSVNFMTLLDAQMTLNRYRQELVTLEAEEGKAWATLEMLTGRVLVDARSAQPARPAGEPRR